MNNEGILLILFIYLLLLECICYDNCLVNVLRESYLPRAAALILRRCVGARLALLSDVLKALLALLMGRDGARLPLGLK